MQVLSFGAGVQSVTIMEMIFAKELPRPGVVIFADTQNEPQSVYDAVSRASSRCNAIGLPFFSVTKGDLGAWKRNRSVHVPLFTVDQTTGENFIIVASGANSCLSPALAALASEAIRAADVVLCQLESPLETVAAALTLAREAGVTTILNPAPASEIPESLLLSALILTPNEHEAAFLVNEPNATPEQAAHKLHRRGVQNVVVTLGAAGALLVNALGAQPVAGRKVPQVIDTTAAGDCFSGALAVGLAEGKPLEEAILFANAAAALSVTKPGAQPSLPTRAAVNQFLMDQVFSK